MAKRKKISRRKKPIPVETRIVSALRKVWRWSAERRAVKNASKRGEAYECSVCFKLHEKIEIDHLHDMFGLVKRVNSPSNSDWTTYISLLFCPANELRAVCRSCHRSITAAQRKASTPSKPKSSSKRAK